MTEQANWSSTLKRPKDVWKPREFVLEHNSRSSSSTAHVNSVVASIGQTCLEYQRTRDDITIGCGGKTKAARTCIGGEAVPPHPVVVGASLPSTELPNEPSMCAGSVRASAIGFANARHPTTGVPDLTVG
jgi:hypothetical protein